MMNEIIGVGIGFGLGLALGYFEGRNNPKKLLLRIAYLDGRIDASEGNPNDRYL